MKYLFIIIILLNLQVANATPEFEFNTTNGYISNKMKNASLIETGVSSNSFDAILKSDSKFSFGAGLSNISYFKLPDRNYFSYYAGLNYSSFINESKSASLNVFSAANIRSANEDNSYSDSKQMLAAMQIKYLSTETSLVNFGLNFRYKNYDYLNELRFLENKISSSYSKSFQTKTSINLSSEINSKIYSNKMDEIVSTSGKNNKNIGQLNKLAAQLYYQISVAQNILEKTGLRLSYNQSLYIKDFVPPLDFVGYDFSGDGEFFDDPFSYEQQQISARVTQILPLDIKLTANYSYSMKSYNYMIFITEDNYTDRDDKNSSYSLSIEKNSKIDIGFINSINLKLDYEYFNNISTMPSMNYFGNYFLIGIELGF